MLILSYILSLGSLVCWIITLIQMFQKESILKGILGIICGIWAFVWGWMNTDKTDQKMVMIIWTGCWLLGMVTGAMATQ